MTKGKVKPTSVRISEKLLERIDMICNDADCSRNDYITFVLDESVHNEIDETENQELEPLKHKRPRIFDCENGFLYENGSKIGNCSDFDLRNGDVYDKENNLLGITKGKHTSELKNVRVVQL